MADMTTTTIRVDTIQDEFIDFILSLMPTSALEQMGNYRLPKASEAYISSLLEANRTRTLTAEEGQELDDYDEVEHWMTLFKLTARLKLKEEGE